MKCVCDNDIEPARVKLGLKVCLKCAENGIGQTGLRKGIMVFSHKTGGDCQVVSPENFNNYRRHNPYGRNTGRGSGVHRVMEGVK